MHRFTNLNEKSLYVSYLISLRIAKAGKPLTIGRTLVFPATKDTVKVFFGEKSEKGIESIHMTNSSVTRRKDEMSPWVENRFIESPFFLQLDGSTDLQVCSNYLFLYVKYGTPNLMKICCCVNQSVEVPAKKFLILFIVISEQKVLIGINV